MQGGWAGAGGTGNVVSNPLFIDAASGDFRLPTGPFPPPGFPASLNQVAPTLAIDSADLTSYTSVFGARPLRSDDIYGNARDLEYTTLTPTLTALLDMGAAEAFWADCSGNGISDQCDVSCALGLGSCTAHANCGSVGDDDCNSNGAYDFCEVCGTGNCDVANAACADCNGANGLDSCEIAADGSLDGNGDGVLDSCNCFSVSGGRGEDITGAPSAVVSNWSQGTNWVQGVPPINGVDNFNAAIDDAAADILVDVDVIVDSIGLDEGSINVVGATSGDLDVVAAGGMRVSGPTFGQGTINVDNNRAVTVSATLTLGPNGVYRKDPAATGSVSASLTAGSIVIREGSMTDMVNGGSLTLEDTMSLTVAGDLVLEPRSSDPAAASATASVGITPPPTFCLKGDSGASISGDLNLAARGTEACMVSIGAVGAGPTLTLAGDFINQSTDPSLFDWSGGVLFMNGSESQTLEVAGIDLGQTETGFTNNFAINEIEVAANQELVLVNEFANTTVAVGVCNEALYLRKLTLQPGSSVILANAKLYVDEIVDNGGRIVDGACGGFRCPLADPPEPGAPDVATNRFVSVRGGNAGKETTMRVTFVDLASDYSGWENGLLFVGAPIQVCENSGHGLERTPPNCGAAPGLDQDWFWAAPLVCSEAVAATMDWSTLGNYCVRGDNNGGACIGAGDCPNGSCGSSAAVHLYHEGIVPSELTAGGGSLASPTLYNIQALDAACSTTPESNYSIPLAQIQSAWGDIVFSVGDCPNGPPNLNVDVLGDVVALINKFSNLPCAVTKARAELQPAAIDFRIDFIDVISALGGFQGDRYPFTPGAGSACP